MPPDPLVSANEPAESITIALDSEAPAYGDSRIRSWNGPGPGVPRYGPGALIHTL